MSSLSERLISVDRALGQVGIPHAFGGAIALAYCTQEPRGTRDLDVNVFVGVERADEVLDALPDGVRVTKTERAAAKRNGQVRVMWDDTPIDVFFAVHQFHNDIGRETLRVPFEGSEISVLGCEALAVFKAMFNRTRDWADIEAMLGAGAMDGRRTLERLRLLLGAEDPAVVRFRALVE